MLSFLPSLPALALKALHTAGSEADTNDGIELGKVSLRNGCARYLAGFVMEIWTEKKR